MEMIMADNQQLHTLKHNIQGWNKWRKENPDVKIDLTEANFNGINLSGINLSEADLWGTTLVGAGLSDANLRRASLERADLSNASLSRAHLLRSNFSQTILSGTNFSSAFVSATIFANVDLQAATGLEEVRHGGPSSIGTDTLVLSKGKIPVMFLRGCGLSDIEIEFAQLAARGLDSDQVARITYEIYRLYCDQPIQFYSCFISYNSKDQKFAQRLHDDLQNNGVRCWFAPEDLKIGDEFRRTIGQQIRVRDKLLIILSKNSIGSEWVGDEVEKALGEEREQKALKLFPIRLDSAVLKAKDDWAEKIRLRRHIGDFSVWKDDAKYKIAFERLLKDLKA
jgi:hypothetical protein